MSIVYKADAIARGETGCNVFERCSESSSFSRSVNALPSRGGLPVAVRHP